MGPWEEALMGREGSKDGQSKGGRRWCTQPPWRGPVSATQHLFLCEEQRVTYHHANVIQRGLPAAAVEDNWVPSIALLGSHRTRGLWASPWLSPWRLALTLKKMLWVKSQKAPLLSPQAIVLCDSWERPGPLYENDSTSASSSAQPRESLFHKLD